jgi:hypothetical protein
MKAADQETIISDVFLIAKAVKEHLKEDNCTHSIRFIVKHALESKSVLREPTSEPADDDGTPTTLATTRNDHQ